MLVFLSIMICLVPALAVIYPFIRSAQYKSFDIEDGTTRRRELENRCDMALDELKNTEFEMEIGNLESDDFKIIRANQMEEAALLLRDMERLGIEVDEVDGYKKY